MSAFHQIITKNKKNMKAKKIITMIAMLLTTIGAMAGTDKFTLTDVTYPYVQQSNTNNNGEARV